MSPEDVAEARIVRPTEVGKVLGVSPRTVTRMIADGILPHVQVSPGCIGVLVEDLSDYIRSSRKVGR